MSVDANELLTTIRNLAITKQLNVLIGSGASMPAIPLMKMVDGNDCKEKNENLVSIIKKVSNNLLKSSTDKNEKLTLQNYINFILQILFLLNLSNSRQTPRSVNLFTTNYDLFIETSIDKLLMDNKFIFNDGTNGYFNRYLDSMNYNKIVSYKGINDNYINELPTINLIKPHGSVNWEKEGDKIRVTDKVIGDCVVVKPTGIEGQETFLNNYFHDMLRLFQLELDKPQSVLFVIGFSFQDKHIAKMFKRALQNSELLAIIFCFSNNEQETIKNNWGIETCGNNLKILTPNDFSNDKDGLRILNKNINEDTKEEWMSFTITSLTKVFEGNGNEW